MRWLTAGESHGQALVGIIEGIPAGVEIDGAALDAALARRRFGYGRGARMGFEKDNLRILGGVRHGVALGSPIALEIENTEWPKWEKIMNDAPVAAEFLQGKGRNAPLTRPRPGHADFTGMQKYGFDEARPVLERASARETAMRVALGAVAAAVLNSLGAATVSHTVAIAGVHSAGRRGIPRPDDVETLDHDPVRCFDPESAREMVAAIDDAKKEGETLGGVVEVLAYGVPPGIGSYVHWDRRLDSKLAGALMGIQAIKGVEIGDGFATAGRLGSAAHDEMRPSEAAVMRDTNRAGGIEGGMSTGDAIRVRAAMKPIATVPRALRTVDVATGEPAAAHHQRSDVCAVPAAGVVAEAMVNLILAQSLQEKFGGDSIGEMKRNMESYLESIPGRLKSRTNPSL